MSYNYYVYLMTNMRNTVIYTGVTNDLSRRVSEQKLGIYEGFTKTYNLKKLVYYEAYDDVEFAIQREKQIKAGSRLKKADLIMKNNPGWLDLVID